MSTVYADLLAAVSKAVEEHPGASVGIVTRVVMAVNGHGWAHPSDLTAVSQIEAILDGHPIPGTEPAAWVVRLMAARNLSGPGLIAVCQSLAEDEEAPDAAREIARRVLSGHLFRDDHARARTTDPTTSKDAAERIRPFVRRPGSKVHRILRAYADVVEDPRAAPGMWGTLTAREVEERANVTEAHKRTSELLRDDLLEVVQVDDEEGTGVDGLADLVRDGGRVLRLTPAGREELARLDAAAASKA